MAIYTATGAGDLQAAFTAANASGDIVFCDFATATLTSQYTWTAPANAILHGRGGANTYGDDDLTTIINGWDNAGATLLITTNASGTFRCYGIKFDAGSTSIAKSNGVIGLYGTCQLFRFDHNHLYTTGSAQLSPIQINGSINGVCDHNTVDAPISNPVGSNVNGFRTYNRQTADAWGDNSWNAGPELGGAAKLYYEDNVFNNGAFNDGTYGSRWVARFNTCNSSGGGSTSIGNSFFQTHPTTGGNRVRGSRCFESYCNRFIPVAGSYNTAPHWYSSGAALIWGNTATAESPGGLDAGYKYFINVLNDRATDNPYGASPSPTGWGYSGPGYHTGTVTTTSAAGVYTVTKVSGDSFSTSWAYPRFIWINGVQQQINDVASATIMHLNTDPGNQPSPVAYITGSPWDGNTNDVSGYPALDQPCRGRGDLLINDFPSQVNHTLSDTVAWPRQDLEPLYEWLDDWTPTPHTGGTAFINFNFSDYWTAAVDYYLGTGTTSVTGGVGSGTLASRPGSATDGEGYFATDQGSWNTGTNSQWLPPKQGKLYVWSGGAWTDYYTPYQYPHPLVTAVPATPALNYTMA